MSIVIRRLPSNTKGRDFFVGDIHGAYTDLLMCLQEVRFDEEVDRLFSVGDLVDRGHENIECLRLLSEPWFYAVMGNHEDLLLSSWKFHQGRMSEHAKYNCHVMNGGSWVNAYLGSEELGSLIPLVEDLPHVLVIGEGESRINVVHSEFPDGMGDAEIDAGLPDAIPADLIWSRRIMSASIELPERQEGLSMTVCGHTPDYDARIRLSHLCIDTGACFNDGRFTLIEGKNVLDF